MCRFKVFSPWKISHIFFTVVFGISLFFYRFLLYSLQIHRKDKDQIILKSVIYIYSYQRKTSPYFISYRLRSSFSEVTTYIYIYIFRCLFVITYSRWRYMYSGSIRWNHWPFLAERDVQFGVHWVTYDLLYMEMWWLIGSAPGF